MRRQKLLLLFLFCLLSFCVLPSQGLRRRRITASPSVSAASTVPISRSAFAPSRHPPSPSASPFPPKFPATPLTEHDHDEHGQPQGAKEQTADGNRILQWNRNAIKQLAYVVPHENAVLKEMHANMEADQKYRVEQAVKHKVEEGVKLGEVKNKQKEAITKEKVFQFSMDKTNEEFKKRAAEEAIKSVTETKRQADEQLHKDQHMAEAFTSDQKRQQAQFALEFKLWKEQVRHEDELLNEQKTKLLASLERSTKIAAEDSSHEHSEESSEDHHSSQTRALFSETSSHLTSSSSSSPSSSSSSPSSSESSHH